VERLVARVARAQPAARAGLSAARCCTNRSRRANCPGGATDCSLPLVARASFQSPLMDLSGSHRRRQWVVDSFDILVGSVLHAIPPMWLYAELRLVCALPALGLIPLLIAVVRTR